jgi:hypothetical protein
MYFDDTIKGLITLDTIRERQSEAEVPVQMLEVSKQDADSSQGDGLMAPSCSGFGLIGDQSARWTT